MGAYFTHFLLMNVFNEFHRLAFLTILFSGQRLTPIMVLSSGFVGEMCLTGKKCSGSAALFVFFCSQSTLFQLSKNIG